MFEINRRNFIFLGLTGFISPILARSREAIGKVLAKFDQPSIVTTLPEDHVSDIFLAKNGSPQENVAHVLEMMGGIEKFRYRIVGVK